jgi:hypothetical protein
VFLLTTVDQGSTSQQVVNGPDAQIIVPNGNYSNVCGTNNIIYFTPLSPLTGQTIYYECRFHRFMGWKINIVPETFCNKYTRLTSSPSQQAFMTTFLNSTNPPGVFARLTGPNAITRSFFDGILLPFPCFPFKKDYSKRINTNSDVFFFFLDRY